MSRQPETPPKNESPNDETNINRRGFIRKAGATSFGASIGGIGAVGIAVASDCYDCTDGDRTECSDVDCVNCNDIDDHSTYLADTDRWRYWEGGDGTWNGADYKSYEEINSGLVYYGTVPNCTEQYVHQFRFVGHGRREVNGYYDSRFYDDADLRQHEFRIWEASDRGSNHSIFSSNDRDELGCCPVPSNEDTAEDIMDLAWTAGTAALTQYNPYIGYAWAACTLASKMYAVYSSPDGSNDSTSEVKYLFDYGLSERPAEVGHFIDFYVETDPGVDCKINASSGLQGEGTAETGMSMSLDTPYDYTCPDTCTCSSSLSTSSTSTKQGIPIPEDVPKDRVKIVEPDEQDQYVLPPSVRGTDEKIPLMFLPVEKQNYTI